MGIKLIVFNPVLKIQFIENYGNEVSFWMKGRKG